MRVLLFALLLSVLSSPAFAKIKYYTDPIYKKMAEEDHHPMDEVYGLAEEGDVRAQFIIADLYSKGKGGYAKDKGKATHWFERAAIHGYHHSFIRLAALSKSEEDYTSAWKWYTLAIRSLPYGDTRKYAIKARAALVEEHTLSQSDINVAREQVSQWETFRNKERIADRKRLKERKLQKKKDIAFEKSLEKDLLVDEGVE